MVACLGRKVGKEFDSGLILQSQSRSLCVYPRLKLAAVGKMKSVQERPFVVADRRGPLTRANRFLEFPGVDLNQVRIEPELSSRRENEIASESVSDRVDRLIERVPCKRARAFRPEVGLDTVAERPACRPSRGLRADPTAAFVARLAGPDLCRRAGKAFPEARGPTFFL